jgi:hypothetical protein
VNECQEWAAKEKGQKVGVGRVSTASHRFCKPEELHVDLGLGLALWVEIDTVGAHQHGARVVARNKLHGKAKR